jgi:osmotically-inducible protein OsmY
MRTLTIVSLAFLIVSLLTGCTAAVVGGAVAGTSVALDNRTTGNFVEDQNIKTKFAHLYYSNKNLSEQTHVNYTSYNRQILITGEAPNEQMKQQLSSIAEQIKNVRHYYNEVVIAQPTSLSTRSNDTLLTSKIKTAVFTNMKELDGAQVKVVTENGSVFLMGLVSREQGNKITEIARTTRGVKRVIKLFEYPNPNDNRI